MNDDIAYGTLEEAWEQCQALGAECGVVMQLTEDEFHLRRSNDPFEASAEDFPLLVDFP